MRTNRADDSPGSAEWGASSGSRYAFDGVFYSFVNSAGQGIKLWTPPGDGRVRGIILFGNPGGGLSGDTRNKSRQRDIVEFAARHHFGVGGVIGFPGTQTYEKLGRHVLDAFREWARHGVHPELEHVPFIFSGSSNAGVFSFALMMLVPERTIGITPNVGPFYQGKIDDAVRKVPAWMHVGTFDPLIPGGFQATEALFAEHLPQGALWTWEAEMKGHENGSSDHVDFAFWDAIIGLRLPAGEPSCTSPVALRDLAPATGWRTDFGTWDHAIAKVFPATEPTTDGEKGRQGWVPTEGIARLYQAAASRVRQISLSFVETKTVAGGASTGRLLSAGGSHVVSPGDTVAIQVKLAPLQLPFKVIEFYDRAEKIGEIRGAEIRDFAFAAQDRPLYAIHARAFHQGLDGKLYECVSNPLQVVIRQPKLSAAIDAQWAGVDWLINHKTRAVDPGALDRLKADPGRADDHCALRAVFLDNAQAAALRSDGAGSSLWQTVHGVAPAIVIDQKSELNHREGDVDLRVSAAYGEAGLHLLFRVKDGSGKAGGERKAGRIDFHLASVGLPSVRRAGGSLEVYASPMVNSLLCNALQMAFDAGGDASVAAVSVNHWDPWDMSSSQLTAADQFGGTGLELNRVRSGDGTEKITLFLPWALVGNPGLRGKPAAGTSLATVMGYSASNRTHIYRWPGAKDPWMVSPLQHPETPVFGEILLLAKA